jgi:hypothetical protein
LLKGRCPKWINTLTVYKQLMEQLDADEEASIEAEVAAATAEAPAAEDASSEEAEDEEEEEEEEAADKGDSATGTVTPTLVVSFNKELMLATRHDVSVVGNPNKETSLPIALGAETALDKMTLVQATFKDGSMAVVPGLTVASYRALLKRGDGEKTKIDVLWCAEHTDTKHAIYMQQRIDRQLLLSLYEQTRQRLQIRVDLFGEVSEQNRHLPKDDEVLGRALAFMVPIAEQFASGQVRHGDLITLRNDMLKARGSVDISPMKRPAAAEVASESQAAPAKKEAKTSMQKKQKPKGSTSAKASHTIIDSGDYQELPRPPVLSLFEQFLLNDASQTADDHASARSSKSL